MGYKTNCPYCAEMIQAEAIVCKHCKSSLQVPPPRHTAPPPRVKSGSNNTVLIIVLCVVLAPCLIGLGVAVLLPAFLRTQNNARTTDCANNLSQLWKMQNGYMVQYGGPQKMMPTETGGDFWLKLSHPKSQLIDPAVIDIYVCPLTGNDWEGGETEYRGPSSNVNKYRDGDPVGADRIDNHGFGEGGNVLRKSGDVQTVEEGDSLWTLSLLKTIP